MLIVFTGDPYLARRALEKERRLAHLPPGLSPPEEVAELATPGLFAPAGGAVDFRELDAGTWESIKPLLEILPPEVRLLILDPKPSSGRSRWYKGRAEVRHYPTPRFRERLAFVQTEMKRHGVKAPAAVAQLLAESEADTEGLVREVEKLALATPPITPEKAAELLAAPPATSAFDLLAPLARGELGEALAGLSQLLAKGEAPLKILGALSWHYVKLYRLGLKSPRPRREEEAARQLGVSPFAARRLLEAARRIPPPRLAQSLEALLEAETAIKQGRDPELALEALFLRLARP